MCIIACFTLLCIIHKENWPFVLSKAPIKIHIQHKFRILDRTCIDVNRERHNHFLFRGLLPLLVKLVHHQERENWPNVKDFTRIHHAQFTLNTNFNWGFTLHKRSIFFWIIHNNVARSSVLILCWDAVWSHTVWWPRLHM